MGPITEAMPTTFRFILICATLGAICYGVLYALATMLEPAPTEITVTIPPSRYAK
jgi:hypothetical protein